MGDGNDHDAFRLFPINQVVREAGHAPLAGGSTVRSAELRVAPHLLFSHFDGGVKSVADTRFLFLIPSGGFFDIKLRAGKILCGL